MDHSMNTSPFLHTVLLLSALPCMAEPEPQKAVRIDPPLTTAESLTWHTNLEKAIARAQKDHKDIYLEFTGTDWCPGCIHLKNTVQATMDFRDRARSNYICVLIDFPRKTKLPEQQAAYNENIRSLYNITSFPTVLLLDEQGRPYATVAGSAQNIEAYLKRLDQAQAIKTARNKDFDEAAQATGDAEKLQVLHRALQTVDPALRPFYPDILQEIERLDPQNTLGYKGTVDRARIGKQQRSDYEKLLDECRTAYRERKMQTCIDLTEQFLNRTDLLPPVRQKALLHQHTNYAMVRNMPKALQYIKEALAADPESKEAQKIQSFIENLERHIQGEASSQK